MTAREPAGGLVPPDLDRSPESIGRYLEDAAHYPGGAATGIARPRHEGEVAALVRSAARLLVVGAQSSLTGGATPAGDIVLSTERLTSIEPVGVSGVRVGAGVSLDALQAWLAARGRWYPPVPTFTGASAGGVVSTNAAGAATFKYGTTRTWVDGLTVVLACGHVLELERGRVRAHPHDGFRIECACGTRQVRPGSYQLPEVPKCSAGYFAAPEMDLIDLFIGAEGTLGIIVTATFRTLPARPAVAMAIVPAPTETDAIALTGNLRDVAKATWANGDPQGLDVAAIEQLDRRCLEILREDGVADRCRVSWPNDTAMALLVQIELPPGTTAARGFDQVAAAFAPGAPVTPLGRFCQLLDRYHVFDHTQLALPGDERRAQHFLEFREGAPVGVNRRVAEAGRTTGDRRIQKTAADMIVPFDRFGEMLARYHDGYRRRGLDHAIWGHISDGNVHPNVIPCSYDDVVAGQEAILEFGAAVQACGGCPLAEHGVGRSPLKQALLRTFLGDDAIGQMRAIKRALDPEYKLARGVVIEA
ncbi:MAG TPA: FAD-binding oxidoreductase [Vicinamibacterales bacterium]|nr:FAD-binding oxidoreductase [Vicinamibacterales bacterium]